MRAAWRALLLGGWSIFVCVACGVPEGTLEELEPQPDTSLESQSQAMALDPAGRGMLAYYTFDGGQVGTQTIPPGADFSGSNRVAGKYGLVDLLQVGGRAAASFGGSGCFTTNAVPPSTLSRIDPGLLSRNGPLAKAQIQRRPSAWNSLLDLVGDICHS